MGTHDYSSQPKVTVPQAQQIIYDFLLDIVKVWAPEDVLVEFRHLFIENTESISSETLPAVHVILFANDQQEFRHTIKRCCYILVNNWEVARQFNAIRALIETFDDPLIRKRTFSPTLKRLRRWIVNFVDSQDFQELRLFAARLQEERSINRPGEWASRYTSYLLAPQYVDKNNPIEQREAARSLAHRLKTKFKFDLAMYTAHSQVASTSAQKFHNPTNLGDGVLRLIQSILAHRGPFSYKNLAHLFLEQVADLRYINFKRSLVEYLLFSVAKQSVAAHLKDSLVGRLDQLYIDHEQDPVDRTLILRTCNRLIDCLLTENKKEPSYLFSFILSQGNYLTLAIMLLKLVLISRGSLIYLEVRLADLIRYYEQFPQEDCQWVINFLEIFQVTFAIYTDNVEYNIIRTQKVLSSDGGINSESLDDITAFRIFSQTLYDSVYDFSEDLTLD